MSVVLRRTARTGNAPMVRCICRPTPSHGSLSRQIARRSTHPENQTRERLTFDEVGRTASRKRLQRLAYADRRRADLQDADIRPYRAVKVLSILRALNAAISETIGRLMTLRR